LAGILAQGKTAVRVDFQQVSGFDGVLFRPADLPWPEFPPQLLFDREAEA